MGWFGSWNRDRIGTDVIRGIQANATTHERFVDINAITELMLLNPYAKQVVKLPIDDALGGGREFTGEDKDIATWLSLEEKYKISETVRTTLINYRTYGAALVVPIFAGNELFFITPYDITAINFHTDLANINFGTVKNVQFKLGNETKLMQGSDIIYVSQRPERELRDVIRFSDYVEASVLQNLRGVFELIVRNIEDILTISATSRITYYFLDNTSTMVMDIAANRLQDLHTLKSNFSAAIFGKDDKVQTNNPDLSPQINAITKALEIISGVSQIPVSRFVGQAGGGALADKGANDNVNYEKTLLNIQTHLAVPLYDKIDAIIAKKEGLQTIPKYNLARFVIPTELEETQIELNTASTISALIAAGALPAYGGATLLQRKYGKDIVPDEYIASLSSVENG